MLIQLELKDYTDRFIGQVEHSRTTVVESDFIIGYSIITNRKSGQSKFNVLLVDGSRPEVDKDSYLVVETMLIERNRD